MMQELVGLKVGDKVKVRIHSYSNSLMQYGCVLIVNSCQEEQIHSGSYSYNGYGSYLRFDGISGRFRNDSNKFEKVNGEENMTALLSDKRPCLVTKLADDGSDTNYVAYDDIGEAKDKVKSLITKEIRETNIYSEYRIYVEQSVARATEPPVTFE